MHGQIDQLIQDDWEDLLGQVHQAETALMETWTSEENAIANADTAVRKARLGEAAEGDRWATGLLEDVQAEPQRLQEEAAAAAKASAKRSS